MTGIQVPRDPIKEAIELRHYLLGIAGLLRVEARTATVASKRMALAMDSDTVEKAAQMLQKLTTEIMKLRVAIEKANQGKLTLVELSRLAELWNGD